MTATPTPADDTGLDHREASLRTALEEARDTVLRAERRAERARRLGNDPEPARADAYAAQLLIQRHRAELEAIRFEREDRAAARGPAPSHAPGTTGTTGTTGPTRPHTTTEGSAQ
ncbi:hypothetical protein ABTY61_22735 [Kitasatospora sp. NPDC096128]|uniref:hypothetical protein n=1 Tax=Kitasatospora sp. NPDC096128 TaxID=3155547 RepID=UPI00332CE549